MKYGLLDHAIKKFGTRILTPDQIEIYVEGRPYLQKLLDKIFGIFIDAFYF
jgi:hypothetical protein